MTSSGLVSVTLELKWVPRLSSGGPGSIAVRAPSKEASSTVFEKSPKKSHFRKLVKMVHFWNFW